MLMGIISDTHDNPHGILRATAIFNEYKVGLVIHCGDWVSPNMPNFFKGLNSKIISVFGNNEGDKYRFLRWWPDIKFYNDLYKTEIDGKRIAVYHGHEEDILDSIIKSKKFDVVISGHTHESVIESINNVLHINPGSPSGIKWDKADNEKSVAIYNTSNNKAEIIKL